MQQAGGRRGTKGRHPWRATTRLAPHPRSTLPFKFNRRLRGYSERRRSAAGTGVTAIRIRRRGLGLALAGSSCGGRGMDGGARRGGEMKGGREDGPHRAVHRLRPRILLAHPMVGDGPHTTTRSIKKKENHLLFLLGSSFKANVQAVT